MEYKSGNTIAVRLDVGDAVKPSLRKIITKEDLTAAKITGVGALKDFTIGYFQTDTGEYQRSQFSASHELTNATGVISRKEGEPHIHLHVTLAGPDHQAIGGHLHEGVVAAAGEFFLTPLSYDITREHNSDLNLDVMTFGDD